MCSAFRICDALTRKYNYISNSSTTDKIRIIGNICSIHTNRECYKGAKATFDASK